MKVINKIFFTIALVLIVLIPFLMVGCDNSKTYIVDVAYSQFGTIEGDGEFAEGQQCVLTATPKEGYYFEKWSDGNDDNPRRFWVEQDYSLSAIFSEGTQVKYKGKKISVKNGTIESYNETKFEIIAKNESKFGYWEDSNGNIYSTVSTFYLNKSSITKDLTIEAKDTACGFYFGIQNEINNYNHIKFTDIGNITWLSSAYFYEEPTVSNPNRVVYSNISLTSFNDNSKTFRVDLNYKNTSTITLQTGRLFRYAGQIYVAFKIPQQGYLTISMLSKLSYFNGMYNFDMNLTLL